MKPSNPRAANNIFFIFTPLLGLFFLLSCFATGVMSYISMAVPIGPWIDSTIVLLAMLLFSLKQNGEEKRIKNIALVTAAGGIGGILATGMGFSFPALYFLDKISFGMLLENPISFCLILAGLAFSAGSLGLTIAQIFEKELIIKQDMPF